MDNTEVVADLAAGSGGISGSSGQLTWAARAFLRLYLKTFARIQQPNASVSENAAAVSACCLLPQGNGEANASSEEEELVNPCVCNGHHTRNHADRRPSFCACASLLLVLPAKRKCVLTDEWLRSLRKRSSSVKRQKKKQTLANLCWTFHLCLLVSDMLNWCDVPGVC